MQLDFHYYTIYTLSSAAGFSPEESEIIAYASEYVDDSIESEPINLQNGQIFDTTCTAYAGIKSFNWDIQKKIYMPFHYLPNLIRREHPEEFSYTVKPSTEDQNLLSNKLFNVAIKETHKNFRLIKIGIALHTIADTFSHQRFSGEYNKINRVSDIQYYKYCWGKRFTDSFFNFFYPPIGHQKVLLYPDYPYALWSYQDSNKNTIIRNNTTIFLCAVGQLLKLLKQASHVETTKDIGIIPEIVNLFKCYDTLENRCSLWQQTFNIPKYDPLKWRKMALEGNVEWSRVSKEKRNKMLSAVTPKEDFDNSLWALFHCAAAQQRALVLDWIN